MSLATLAAAALFGALLVYLLSGGADFGGGMWTLAARGSRHAEHRRALRAAIAPIWEANHVWLIVAVVLLFSCFPRAFAAISIALHIPVSLLLVGIVLRGSAFVFGSYSAGDARLSERVAPVFALASLLTPFMLGVCLGALAAGDLAASPAARAQAAGFHAVYVAPWCAPFPLTLGLFAVVTCAFLAAVYMTVETGGLVRATFRRWSLGAASALLVVAVLGALVSAHSAPDFAARLLRSAWSPVLFGATAITWIAALWALVAARYKCARAAAIAVVALIFAGFGAAQHPYLIADDLTIAAAAAPEVVLKIVLAILAVGALLLVPAFVYLYRVFKP